MSCPVGWQLLEGAGPAQGSTVFDDSQDLERLGAVQQHIASDIEGKRCLPTKYLGQQKGFF